MSFKSWSAAHATPAKDKTDDKVKVAPVVEPSKAPATPAAKP